MGDNHTFEPAKFEISPLPQGPPDNLETQRLRRMESTPIRSKIHLKSKNNDQIPNDGNMV